MSEEKKVNLPPKMPIDPFRIKLTPEMMLPADKEAPLVLDDALSDFDDGRMALALECLRDLSRKRQVLLFTCHSREADFFLGDAEVSVQRLSPAKER